MSRVIKKQQRKPRQFFFRAKGLMVTSPHVYNDFVANQFPKKQSVGMKQYHSTLLTVFQVFGTA